MQMTGTFGMGCQCLWWSFTCQRLIHCVTVFLLERTAPFWWPLPTQNTYFFTFHSSVCSYGYIKKYVLWVGRTELFAVETWSIPFPPFDSETFWLLIWNSDRSCAEISLSETKCYNKFTWSHYALSVLCSWCT